MIHIKSRKSKSFSIILPRSAGPPLECLKVVNPTLMLLTNSTKFTNFKILITHD